MTEQEWRDCFAMFRATTGASAEECYRFADEMMEARKEEQDDGEELGIAAIKPKRKYLRRSSR